LQRVVGCIHAIVHHCDGGIVCAVRWINLSQYASCRLILGGGPRDILGSILFISGAKVSGLVADVTRRDRPVSPELALQAQIPPATISPNAGPCLNPCPDPPPTIHTVALSGCRSTMKLWSVVFSYWQTRLSSNGAPFIPGKRWPT